MDDAHLVSSLDFLGACHGQSPPRNTEVYTSGLVVLDAVGGVFLLSRMLQSSLCTYRQPKTLRWCPSLPLGASHNTTENVWYDSQRTTIANLWQCHHDPAFY